MSGKAHAQAALQPDIAAEATRPVVAESPVRLVQRPDRRQDRVATPDCPRCQRSDGVSVRERSRVALRWRCSRCDLLWTQPLRRTRRATGRCDNPSGRPVVSHWTCPTCERYTVRFATAARCVTYYGCGAVDMSGQGNDHGGRARGCWEPGGPLRPGCDGQRPTPADSNDAGVNPAEYTG